MHHSLPIWLSLASAAPGDASFHDWLREAIEEEGLRVLRWGPADLDRDGERDEAFAFVCNGDGARPSWIVLEQDGQRWVVERSAPCTAAKEALPAWTPSDDTAIDLGGGGTSDRVTFGVVDGELEIVRREFESRGVAGFEAWTEDWRNRVTERRWAFSDVPHPADAVPRTDARGAIVVVGPDGGRSTPIDFVIRGERRSSADASIAVGAYQPDPEHVSLVVRVTDDHFVPSASELGDHLLLWWCSAGRSCRTNPGALRHLGVRWTSATDAVAWWPEPVEEPLPDVSVGPDRSIVLTFGVDRFVQPPPGEGEAWRTALTVAFADVDDEGVRSVVATSELQRGETRSLGDLVRFPGHRAFPTGTMDLWKQLEVVHIRQVRSDHGRIRR